MQPTYQPSNILDQRTNCRFSQAQLDELKRREEAMSINIKPSEVAKDVSRRLTRAKAGE